MLTGEGDTGEKGSDGAPGVAADGTNGADFKLLLVWYWDGVLMAWLLLVLTTVDPTTIGAASVTLLQALDGTTLADGLSN